MAQQYNDIAMNPAMATRPRMPPNMPAPTPTPTQAAAPMHAPTQAPMPTPATPPMGTPSIAPRPAMVNTAPAAPMAGGINAGELGTPWAQQFGVPLR